MTMEPQQPQGIPEGQALGYPTNELPTYRKVQAHPEPAPVPPSRPAQASTGELPVTGAPAAPATARPPRGPYVPTVVRGLFVLALTAVVFVWRLADDPDWAVVAITLAIAAGAVLLVAAVASLVVRRVQRERDFDRMLSGS